VTAAWAAGLLVAGIAAGIVSTVVSLASVVSYPVLLALGLSPLSANMTNTVSLVFTGAGAAAGSRPELSGQGRRLRRLGPVAAVGGGAGAALLLVTPADTFERVAPVLIGLASLTLMLPRPARRAGGAGGRAGNGAAGEKGRSREHSRPLLAAMFSVAIYVGYFGAAGGILMLAVLTAMLAEPIVRANAVKNVMSGLANTVAAITFAILGQVDWAAVAPLAAGFLIGGWTGPALVRRLPGQVMRVGVGVCGVGVAVKLGIAAYR
jgi:uncharacterized protein